MEKSLTFRSTLPHFQAMIQRLPLYMYQSCNEDSTKIYVEVSVTDRLYVIGLEPVTFVHYTTH